MPRYLIERDIPGAGDLSARELKAISQTSCDVLEGMPELTWEQSYVTADRITCVYVAPSEEQVRAHADRGGFPADRITEIGSVIGPGTATAA